VQGNGSVDQLLFTAETQRRRDAETQSYAVVVLMVRGRSLHLILLLTTKKDAGLAEQAAEPR
jgi:hypothetical protein